MLHIYDLGGRLVKQFPFSENTKQKFDTALEQGGYLIRAVFTSGEKTYKIMIEK